jgi:hypothetical protein
VGCVVCVRPCVTDAADAPTHPRASGGETCASACRPREAPWPVRYVVRVLLVLPLASRVASMHALGSVYRNS